MRYLRSPLMASSPLGFLNVHVIFKLSRICSSYSVFKLKNLLRPLFLFFLLVSNQALSLAMLRISFAGVDRPFQGSRQ